MSRPLIGLLVVLAVTAFSPLLMQQWKQTSKLEPSPQIEPRAPTTRQPETIPELLLSIPAQSLERLETKRTNAIERGLLVATDEDFVEASLTTNGDAHRVRIRLKGDLSDHWQGDAWSFRVKIRGDKYRLWGMRKFSLQHPQTRGYAEEWLAHQLMRSQDVMALRYRFVYLKVNDGPKRLYALEEHFDVSMVEHNQQREGPILRYDESIFWQNNKSRAISEDSYFASRITTFEEERFSSNEKLNALYQTAASMLEGLRSGTYQVDEVFDIEQTGKFLALSDLIRSFHYGFNNLRLYFNPITQRLEPIAYDMYQGEEGDRVVRPASGYFLTLDTDFYAIQRALYSNDKIIRSYQTHLHRYAQDEFLQHFMQSIEVPLNKILATMAIETPGYQFDTQRFASRQQQLRRFFDPSHPVHAYLVTHGDNSWEVRCASTQPCHWEVSESIDSHGKQQPVDRSPHILLPKIPGQGLTYQTVMQGKADNRPVDVTLSVQLAGVPATRKTIPINRWPYAASPPTILRAHSPSELAKLPWVASIDSNRLVIKRGKWTVTEDVMLPKGLALYCNGGTTLLLEGNATILCQGPVHFQGAEEAPIIIHSATKQTAGSLVVMNADSESTLHHVRFLQLGSPSRPNWSLTGAVTFYQSDVSIHACLFSKNTCEDALNVVRGKLNLANSRFADTFGDALDVDFGTGTITNCKFSDTGNDALDFSGSSFSIRDVQITRAGDKAISAGEATELMLSHISAEQSAIGIAAKDLSMVIGDHCNLRRGSIGIAAFQKKPAFGGGRIILNNSTIEQMDTLALIEQGSDGIFNQKRLDKSTQKVDRLLYGTSE